MFISDKRECSISVCKNGAVCREIEGDYSCSCKEGFAGKNCDRGKTFCTLLRPIQGNSSKISNNIFLKTPKRKVALCKRYPGIPKAELL